jgi:DNA-binding NarL/FixJ family response regulator
MPLRILVVEDHAPFRDLICTALRQEAGFDIIEAADGLESVQKAEALQPDLILLDINLPKIHGFEVAKQVRRLAPDARVLFMSQETAPDIVQKALGLGAGYILKMSAAADLLPAIDAVLAGRRFVSRDVAFDAPADTSVPRRHEILFCSDEEAVVDDFTRYLATALNAADAAIILATQSHQALLLLELRAQGVNIEGAIARGTCLLFDADVALSPVRFLEAIDTVRAAAAKAGKANPRVAFCGERAGRLWAAGRTAEAVELEQFCGDLPDDVDILCAYPVPYTEDNQALTRICAEHTAVSAC